MGEWEDVVAKDTVDKRGARRMTKRWQATAQPRLEYGVRLPALRSETRRARIPYRQAPK